MHVCLTPVCYVIHPVSAWSSSPSDSLHHFFDFSVIFILHTCPSDPNSSASRTIIMAPLDTMAPGWETLGAALLCNFEMNAEFICKFRCSSQKVFPNLMPFL